jgi:hypothetical protein
MVCGPCSLVLRCPKSWYAANPLTEADLSQERVWLEARGFELRLAMLQAAREAWAG